MTAIPLRRRRAAHAPACEILEPRTLLDWSLAATGAQVLSANDGISSVVALDYDGDGLQDLVAASGQRVLLLKGDGAGHFAPAQLVATLMTQVGLLAVGPRSTPGHPELFAAQSGSGLRDTAAVRRLASDGHGGLRITRRALYTGRATALVLARVAGQAEPDVLVTVVSSPATGPLVRQYALHDFRPGVSGYTENGAPVSAIGDIGTPAAVDLDGDGTDEVILPTTNSTTSNGYLRLFTLSGGLQQQTQTDIFGRVSQALTADLDGDGQPEVIVGAARFVGQSIPDEQRVVSVPVSWSAQDGFAFGAPAVLFQRRASVLSTSAYYATADHRVIGVADMNGDGRADLLLSTIFGAGYGGTQGGSQFALLSQLIRQADGTFTEATVRTSKVFYDYTARSTLTTLEGVARFVPVTVRAGRTEVVALDRPPGVYGEHGYGYPPPAANLGQTGLTFLRTVTAVRSVRVAAVRQLPVVIQAGGTYSRATEGSIWSVGADVAAPDLSRGVDVTGVEVFRDSNGDGRWDESDERVGSAYRITTNPNGNLVTDLPEGGSRWRTVFTVPGWWYPGNQTLFFRATDTLGRMTDPDAARITLIIV